MRVLKSFTMIILIGIVAVGVMVTSARAEIVTYNFTGDIEVVTSDGSGSFSGAGIDSNDTFSGSFSYDDAAVDLGSGVSAKL